MAKKSEHRVKMGLKCTVCGSRNYVTQRNKVNTPDKLTLNKYCKKCKKMTPHKEVEKLK